MEANVFCILFVFSCMSNILQVIVYKAARLLEAGPAADNLVLIIAVQQMLCVLIFMIAHVAVLYKGHSTKVKSAVYFLKLFIITFSDPSCKNSLRLFYGKNMTQLTLYIGFLCCMSSHFRYSYVTTPLYVVLLALRIHYTVRQEPSAVETHVPWQPIVATTVDLAFLLSFIVF